MEENFMPAPVPPAQLPPQRRHAPRWLLIGGATVAAVALLGAGVLLGSTILPSFAAGQPQGQQHVGVGRNFAGRGGPGMMKMGRGLIVTTVNANSIVAKDGRGNSVTIDTNSSTKYSRAGKTVTRSAITNGAAIAVRGTRNSDGSITASAVDIVLPSYHGAVTAINGGDITVQDKRNNTTHVIHTDSSTTFSRLDASSSLSAISVGTEISAMGTLNSDNSLKAESVRIAVPAVSGQITKISGNDITVQSPKGVATIHVSGSTTYQSVTLGSNGPTKSAAALSDLKVGSTILAQGTKNSDGSLNAEVVNILPAGAFGGDHWKSGPSGPPAGAPSGTAN